MFLVVGTFAQHHMMWPPRPGDEKYKEGCGKEKEGHDFQSQALKTKWGNSRWRSYPKAWENKRDETEYPPRPGDAGVDEDMGSTASSLSDAIYNEIQTHKHHGNRIAPGKRSLARRKLNRSD